MTEASTGCARGKGKGEERVSTQRTGVRQGLCVCEGGTWRRGYAEKRRCLWVSVCLSVSLCVPRAQCPSPRRPGRGRDALRLQRAEAPGPAGRGPLTGAEARPAGG